MTVEEWSLTQAQRDETIRRAQANISTMAFFRNSPIEAEVVAAAAVAIEKKAYTVARVEARTTTGVRPHHETLKAYVRKLSTLVLEVVESGGKVEQAGAQAGAEAFDLTGSREFLTRETAEEILAPLLAEGARFTKVKFSTKSFGVEAAEVAARALENNAATLVDADMSDIIAGRPEAEALAALRIIAAALGRARLQRLDLSDNALGEKGIRACAAAFQEQEALESIAFGNVGCSVHGCQAVDELLKNTASLKRLHLYNNMSGDEGAAAIARLLARSPQMEDFRMVSSRVGLDGGGALAKALAAGSSLMRLDISDNPMTGEIADDLAAALRQQPGLRALNLNDTCLEDGGVATVAEALAASAPQLEELELALNELTPEGAGAVAACVAAKPSLRVLNLRENELEDEGALIIAKGIVGLQHLETVDLCQNQLKRGGACALAKAAAKPALTLLALDENEISDAGIDALKAIMESRGKLEALGPLDENMAGSDDEDEEGEEVEDGGADELAASLAKATI